MKTPKKIHHIIQGILDSEDTWKSLYMAVWGYAFFLEKKFKNTPEWDKEIKWGLPASLKKHYKYKTSELHGILTSQDKRITLLHLQTLFSLIEELAKEVCPILFPKLSLEQKSLYRFSDLIKFLQAKKPYKKSKEYSTTKEDFLNYKEYPEFILAYETRNCFIHNGSKIDKKWLKAYAQAKHTKPEYEVGGELPTWVPDVEIWHSMFVNIVHKVKGIIEEI